jgi:hypothetical protein
MNQRGCAQLIGMVVGLVACSNATGEAPTAENQLAVTVQYVATEDAPILEGIAANINFGASTTCGAKGDAGSLIGKSCLMRWNVPWMPNVTVNSAWLDLRAVDVTNQTFTVYRVTSFWLESEATWNNRRAGVPWELSGAKGFSERGLSVGAQTFNQADQIFFFNDSVNGGVQMVQSWFHQPWTNFGVIVADSSIDDQVVFASRENATPEYRPTLHVTYTVNGGTGGTGPSTSGTGGAPAGSGP